MLRLIIFAKEPRAGFVKTRLAADFNERIALELYKLFVTDLCYRMEWLKDVDKWMYFTGEEPLQFLNQFPAYKRSRQSDGNLGERMNQAFVQSFKEGCQRVIIIGTDCLSLSADHIQQSFRSLANHDIVLGPTFDGGYYLIGMNQPQPELFEGVDWSTDMVLQQSLNNANENSLNVSLMEKHHDVDDADSLRQAMSVPNLHKTSPRSFSYISRMF